MNTMTVNMASFSAGGDEVYDLIGQYCAPCGSHALVIGGPVAISKARAAMEKAMENSTVSVSEWIYFGDDCTWERVEELIKDDRVLAADMIFGVGGGKAIDTAKMTAGKLNKPFFSFPTIASTCAAVTSVAAMYTPDHKFLGVGEFNHPAAHAFINTRIIAESPWIYMWAGIGDSIAKYYESRLSARGQDVGYTNEMGIIITGMVNDPLMRVAVQAVQDNKAGKDTREVREAILHIIISTGFASLFLDVDTNSSAAHAIYSGLLELPQTHVGHYHGEIVAFGLLVMFLMDNDSDSFEKVYEFNRSMGLPLKLADLGVTVDELVPVCEKACTTPDVRVMPYQVTPDMFRRAFLKLEQYNQKVVDKGEM